MINTTQFTNISGDPLTGLAVAINNESGGIFGFMVLIAIYLLFFLPMLSGWGVRSAFGTAAFIGAIFAIFFKLIGLINDTVLFGAIVLAVVAVLILWFSKDT